MKNEDIFKLIEKEVAVRKNTVAIHQIQSLLKSIEFHDTTLIKRFVEEMRVENHTLFCANNNELFRKLTQ